MGIFILVCIKKIILMILLIYKLMKLNKVIVIIMVYPYNMLNIIMK